MNIYENELTYEEPGIAISTFLLLFLIFIQLRPLNYKKEDFLNCYFYILSSFYITNFYKKWRTILDFMKEFL